MALTHSWWSIPVLYSRQISFDRKALQPVPLPSSVTTAPLQVKNWFAEFETLQLSLNMGLPMFI
jgi:hypothetical protein